MKAILLVILVAISTHVSAQIEPKNSDCLVIGNGGGITGRWEFYKIKANGEVLYKENVLTDYEKIGKISKKTTESYFQQIQDLKLDSLALNQPGNMSFMIEFQNDNNKQKALWSGPKNSSEVPKALTEFYETLIKNLSSKR